MAGVALLAACSKSDPGAGHAAAPTIAVRVASLHLASLATAVDVSGSLVAVRSVTVGAASAGRIVAVNVREGDTVLAGETIAQIDAAASAAGVAQAQAGVAMSGASESAAADLVAAARSAAVGAQARVDAAEATERLAETTAARMASLFAQGAISKQQDDEASASLYAARASAAQAKAGLDAAGSDLRAARARLTAASASSRQAQAGVRAADVPLRDATVTAPFDGIVTTKFVEPGAVVAAGSPIAAIQDDRGLEADVSVANDVVAAIAPGEPVDVRVDAASGALLRGRVRAVIPAQDPAIRSATVKIDVPATPGLLSGMYVRVRFIRHTPRVWVAPLSALVTRAGQSGVFVVRDGRATFVPLQTGTVGKEEVELAGYAGPSVAVAVSEIQRLDDGSAVTVER